VIILRKSGLITCLFSALISTSTASSYLSPSDAANVTNLPSSFVESGEKYTTPALQGMLAHNIDIDWVRRTIGSHSFDGAPVELSSIWKEGK
jgi:hypothetical protein